MSSMFVKKPVQPQRPVVDRFIPSRESFADERRRGSWRYESPEKTVKIWTPELQKQKNYKNYLDQVFGMKRFQPVESRRPEDEAYLQPWPCAPRKKGYLSSVDSILDLPSYGHSIFPEILDWSKNNMLVAALGSNYHMFNWTRQKVVNRKGRALYHIACCKFDPRGDLILLGCQMKMIELHDAKQSRLLNNSSCNCSGGFVNKPCDITTIDWSPSGNSFIIGCSRGNVVSFDQRILRINSSRRLTQFPIRFVKISPDTRYVAVVALNSPRVFFLVWPSLQIHSFLNIKDWCVKTLCWHPWRSALLGLGLMTAHQRTSITMLDVPCSVVRIFDLEQFNGCSLDVMLFCHNTGELVLSLWKSDREPSSPMNGAQLLVMSDPQNVVDHAWNGLDRVRTMVLSPDGTKLATATADEDLIIWNFLPEEKKITVSRSRKFQVMPVLTDLLCTDGFVLR